MHSSSSAPWKVSLLVLNPMTAENRRGVINLQHQFFYYISNDVSVRYGVPGQQGFLHVQDVIGHLGLEGFWRAWTKIGTQLASAAVTAVKPL